MSTMEAEATVESIARTPRMVGLTPLQRFARAGLDLQIGDFRELCKELHDCGLVENDAHEIADILFGWMIETLKPDGN